MEGSFPMPMVPDSIDYLWWPAQVDLGLALQCHRSHAMAFLMMHSQYLTVAQVC